MISRHELGSLLLNWHGSQYDPTYAVGSFYIDNNVYPNKDVVEECIASLELDVSKYRRIQKGERVFAYTAHGSTDDLKTWAGYSDEELVDCIEELTVIVGSLREYLVEDYTSLH